MSTGKGLPRSLKSLYQEVAAILDGGIKLVLTPDTLGSSAAAVNTAIAGDGFSRDVIVELTNANGDRLTSNGSFDIAATKSSTGGTVAIAESATSITLVNGIGVVTLNYDGMWAAEDTCTLTVTGGTVAGQTVSDKTSVDTLVE